MSCIHPLCKRLTHRRHCSYDGDDAPAKEEATAQPDFALEPVEAPAPTENELGTINTNDFNNHTEAAAKDEPMYGNGQNGDAGQAWNGGQIQEGHTNQYSEAQMEHDLPPIGIKEDG